VPDELVNVSLGFAAVEERDPEGVQGVYDSEVEIHEEAHCPRRRLPRP
jgi:hypothetical protein